MVLTRAFGAVLALGLLASPAQADPREEAKLLADNAYALLQQGMYDEAIELFRRADERFHSPVFVLFMAEAEDKLGHLVAAKRLLVSVRDEPLADDAPDTFRNAQREATSRLAELEPRIPRLTIVVSSPARVTLDGEPLRDLDAIEVDPGRHEIVAELDDAREERVVDLGEGQRVEVAFTLVAAAPPAPEPDAGIPTLVWPVAAYGAGAAGLLMGGIAGGLFLSQRSDLIEACAPGDPKRCPPDRADDIDTVQTLGNVATAGWVIAAAGVAAGTVLLFVLDHDAEVAVTPTGATLRGRF